MKRMKSSKEEREGGRKEGRKDYPQIDTVFNHLGEVQPFKMRPRCFLFCPLLSPRDLPQVTIVHHSPFLCLLLKCKRPL